MDVSKESNNESQDMADVSGFMDSSPGPALVSNSSQVSQILDSPAETGGQRPSQSGTITPNLTPASIRDIVGEPAILAPTSVVADLVEGGDSALTGPSIREAEAYADDLTRALLNDTSNLVRPMADARAAEPSESVGQAQMEAAGEDKSDDGSVGKSDKKDEEEEEVVEVTHAAPAVAPATVAATASDEEEVTIKKKDETRETESEVAEREEEQTDDTQPIVKEKMLNVAIGPVTYQFSADSLEESQIEQFNKDDEPKKLEAEPVKKEAEQGQKMDLEPKAAGPEKAVKFEDKENYQSFVSVTETQSDESKRAEEEEEKEAAEIKKREDEKEDEEEEQQQRRKTNDDTWTKLHITNNELLQQTFNTAFNTSQDSDESQDQEHHGVVKEDKMEFTKNYSDDLLMGAGEQARESGGPDLADFELPPYNGSSSSGSEQAASTKQQHSPAKQRKSSNTASTQASSSSSSATTSGLAPSDLTALKNILISSYSKVAHVFHWKKPIESGIIFAIGLTLIAALTFFSIISVIAYSALGIVLVSALIRMYKTSMKALNRSSETPVDHIWEKVLSLNVSMSPERMHELIDSSHANLNASFVYFKQVLLVEDKVATFKFFLFLYSLTYIGAWFNGLTLITIIYVSMFSAPIIYEKNKAKIDEYLNLATSQVSCAISMVTGKVTALAFGGSAQSASAKKQN